MTDKLFWTYWYAIQEKSFKHRVEFGDDVGLPSLVFETWHVDFWYKILSPFFRTFSQELIAIKLYGGHL